MKKVLVLEDVPSAFKKVEEIFRKENLNAVLVYTEHLKQAIDFLEHNSFDCFILQGKAVGGHGTEILSYLSKDDKKKVIICSTLQSFEKIAIKEGAFFWNRYKEEELTNIIKSILLN